MAETRISIDDVTMLGGSIPAHQQAPSYLKFYNYSASDIPGVVAANNFISQFNPANSGKTVVVYFADVDQYATGVSTTPNSMVAYRTTAASGGTLVPASTISRFDPTIGDPVLQIRTGNPTVTIDPVLSAQIFHDPPPISGGAAGASSASTAVPPGATFVIPPGHGAVFQTAAGNTSQMWGFRFIWAEY